MSIKFNSAANNFTIALNATETINIGSGSGSSNNVLNVTDVNTGNTVLRINPDGKMSCLANNILYPVRFATAWCVFDDWNGVVLDTHGFTSIVDLGGSQGLAYPLHTLSSSNVAFAGGMGYYQDNGAYLPSRNVTTGFAWSTDPGQVEWMVGSVYSGGGVTSSYIISVVVLD